MNRWKLVVGMTVGLALVGCEPPVEPPPPPGGDVVVPPPVDEDLEKANALVKEGKDLLAEGKLDEAKAKADEALALKPDLQEAKDLLAEIEAKKEETTTDAGRAAAARKKAQIARLVKEGEALLKQGKLDGAKAKVEEVLKLDAKNADAKKLAGDIAEAKAKEDAGRKLAEQKAALRKKAATLRARGKWEAAGEAYKELLKIEDPKKKAAVRVSANYCRAMRLYGLGQEAGKAGRLGEAQKYYAEAYKMSKLRLFKEALDRVTETRREGAKKAAETKLCAELMASADSLAGEGKLKEAIVALREIAKLKYAPDQRVRQAAEKQAALTKELNYGQCVAAAEAALAEEPPDYAKAAEEYLRAKQFKDLTAEGQENLIECKFQQAAKNGDAAAEAVEGEVPNYAEAIDYYEEALSYKDDEEVRAKLDGVKDLKAVADFASFTETGETAMNEGREADGVSAYELAEKLAEERPAAFEEKAKEVAAAKSKLKKARVQLQKKLSAELTAKWKALLKETGPLKKQPAELKAKLVAQQETFKDSKYAGQLAKKLSVAEKSIDKALSKDWGKLKKQVKKGKDREANIQALTEFLEKVSGTKYEEQVQLELDAQKLALEEAPPVEPEPVEDAAVPEAPPEPVEEVPAG